MSKSISLLDPTDVLEQVRVHKQGSLSSLPWGRIELILQDRTASHSLSARKFGQQAVRPYSLSAETAIVHLTETCSPSGRSCEGESERDECPTLKEIRRQYSALNRNRNSGSRKCLCLPDVQQDIVDVKSDTDHPV